MKKKIVILVFICLFMIPAWSQIFNINHSYSSYGQFTGSITTYSGPIFPMQLLPSSLGQAGRYYTQADKVRCSAREENDSGFDSYGIGSFAHCGAYLFYSSDRRTTNGDVTSTSHDLNRGSITIDYESYLYYQPISITRPNYSYPRLDDSKSSSYTFVKDTVGPKITGYTFDSTANLEYNNVTNGVNVTLKTLRRPSFQLSFNYVDTSSTDSIGVGMSHNTITPSGNGRDFGVGTYTLTPVDQLGNVGTPFTINVTAFEDNTSPIISRIDVGNYNVYEEGRYACDITFYYSDEYSGINASTADISDLPAGAVKSNNFKRSGSSSYTVHNLAIGTNQYFNVSIKDNKGNSATGRDYSFTPTPYDGTYISDTNKVITFEKYNSNFGLLNKSDDYDVVIKADLNGKTDFNQGNPIRSVDIEGYGINLSRSLNYDGTASYYKKLENAFDSMFCDREAKHASSVNLVMESNYGRGSQTKTVSVGKPENRFLVNQNRKDFFIGDISSLDNFGSNKIRSGNQRYNFKSDGPSWVAAASYGNGTPTGGILDETNTANYVLYTNKVPSLPTEKIFDRDGDDVQLFLIRKPQGGTTAGIRNAIAKPAPNSFNHGDYIFVYAEEKANKYYTYLYSPRIVYDTSIPLTNSNPFSSYLNVYDEVNGSLKLSKNDSDYVQTHSQFIKLDSNKLILDPDTPSGYESLEIRLGTAPWGGADSNTKNKNHYIFLNRQLVNNHELDNPYGFPTIDFGRIIDIKDLDLRFNTEDVDRLFYLNIAVYDRAHNTFTKSFPIRWDSRNPGVINHSNIDGSVKEYINESIIRTKDDNFRYNYDTVSKIINLSLKTGKTDADKDGIIDNALGADEKTRWPVSENHYFLTDYYITTSSPTKYSENEEYPVNINSSKTLISVDLPQNDYRSNDKIQIDLKITDFAGNISNENFVYAYTPVKLEGDSDDHMIEIDTEWSNSQGHFLAWDSVQSLNSSPDGDYKSLVLRFDGDYGSSTDPNFIGTGDEVNLSDQQFTTDQVLNAHGIYNFTLHGVNGSDYESSFEGSYISFSRTVKNNAPEFTHFSLPMSYDNPENNVKYAGQKDYISFNAVDNDSVDRFEYFILVDGIEYPFSFDNQEPADSLTMAAVDENIVIPLKDIEYNFENGKEYRIQLKVIDHWDDELNYGFSNETEDISNEHEPVYSQTINFTYDNKAPEILTENGIPFIYASNHATAGEWSYLETRESYSYGSGDFYIAITDEYSGVSDPSLRGSNPALIGEDLNGLRAWVKYETDEDTEEPIVAIENEELICTRLAGNDGYLYRIEAPPEGTNYTIELQFIDNVGNIFTRETEINQGRLNNLTGIYHDDIFPEILSVTPVENKGEVDGTALYSTPSVPVNLKWTDNESGVKTVFYRYLLGDEIIDEGSVASYEGFFEASRSDEWKRNCPLNTVPVEEVAYTLELNIEDFAGNNSNIWVPASSPVVFDLTPPRVVLDKIHGVDFTDKGDWVKDLENFYLEYSVIDFDDSTDNKYRLSRDSEIVIESSDWTAIKSAMENGNTYSISVCARDEAGHLGISKSVSFMLDSEAPKLSDTEFKLLNDQSSWAMGEEVRFRISAQDRESGMKGFKLGIGNASNMIPVITEKIIGHGEDGYLHYSYSDSEIYSFNIPVDSANGFYAYFLSLEDQAGNWTIPTALSEKTLRINHPEEIVVPYDYTPFISHSDQLTGGWNYYGPKEVSHYTYRVVDKNRIALTDWLTTRNNAEMVRFDNAFVHGDQYSFEVKCHLKDGSIVGSRFSNGVFVDQVAPVLNAFQLHPYASAKGMQLSFELTEGDSGVGENLLILEMFERDDSGDVLYEEVEKDGVVSYIPLKKVVDTILLKPEAKFSSSGIKSELLESLKDSEKLLVTLRTSDNAENVDEFYLGAVIVDNSIPDRALIQDAGDFVNPDKNESIRFNWEWSREDEHSGWAESYYQFIKQGGIVSEDDWTKAEEKCAVLNDYSAYSQGDIIICAVKVVNHAGLESIGFSNGIMIDVTMPVIPTVTISGTSGSGKYITSKQLTVNLVSVDPESGIIGYSLERGEYNNTDWNELEILSDFIEGSYVEANTVLPDDIENGSIVYFSGAGTNGAFTRSITGYSDGVLFETRQPEISDFVVGLNRNNLTATWDVEMQHVKANEMKLDLLRSGVVVQSYVLDGNSRQVKLMDLNDGYYQLRLICINEAGISSEPVLSPGILIDNTAPEINRFEYDYFVSSQIDFVIGAHDALSGIYAYRYRIGKMGDPDLFTDGWVTKDSFASEIYSHLVFTDDFSGGDNGVIHNEFMVVEVQAKDRAGNWCAVKSGEPVLIDLTPPENPEIEPNRIYFIDGKRLETEKPYITDIQRIFNMAFSGSDNESGIKAYRWAISDKPALADNEIEWNSPVYINRDVKKAQMDLDGLELLNDIFFEDKNEYYVFLKICNGAGLYSDQQISVPLIADLSAPDVSADLRDTLYTGIEDDDSYNKRIIMNDPGKIFFHINEEIGEYVKIRSTLYSPNAVREQSMDKFIDYKIYDMFDLDFLPLDGNNYGIYLLRTEFIDIGNRTTIISQPVRLNEPPIICQPNRIFTPGYPFVIKDINETTRSTDLFDDIEKMRYTIYREGFEPISSGFLLQEDEWSKISSNQNLTLFHSDIWIPKTVYKLRIEAYDTYGKKAEEIKEITIVNTREGRLYTDEYWIGTHSITDKIIVPSGIKLHVADGTVILPMAGSTYGTRQELLIMPGAELKHYGSALYKSGGDPYAKWEGIDIRGKANLVDILVQDARRAISLSQFNNSILNCTFENNNIGLHLYNSSPTVSGCTFTNNRYYGVKEDGTAVPVFTGNKFSVNGIDYYDTNLTETSVDELNHLGTNSGNKGDEE